MIRIGMTRWGWSDFGIEAPSLADCIRAVHRAPLEVRDAPISSMLITERPDGQIRLLIEARRGVFEAPRREIDDWMTLKSWHDQLTDPDSGIFAEAVTAPDYVYGHSFATRGRASRSTEKRSS